MYLMLEQIHQICHCCIHSLVSKIEMKCILDITQTITCGLRGATVARLTPDQKVACSNHVGVNVFFLLLRDYIWCEKSNIHYKMPSIVRGFAFHKCMYLSTVKPGILIHSVIEQYTCISGISIWTPWRNGSASDSRSEGCVFKSRRGQLSFQTSTVFIN